MGSEMCIRDSCMADRTKATFYGGLHELYTSLIDKYPAARIVVLTPLHPDLAQWIGGM